MDTGKSSLFFTIFINSPLCYNSMNAFNALGLATTLRMNLNRLYRRQILLIPFRTTSTPYERVSWALQQITERGHTFLRQFTIDEAGVVTPLPAIAVTNFLEDLLLGSPPSMSRLPQSDQDVGESLRPIPVTCEQLGAALNILGLLSPDAMFTPQTTVYSSA